MKFSSFRTLEKIIEKNRTAGCERVLRVTQPRSVRPVAVDFSSNDYLGLAQHPDVIGGAEAAARRWGAGSRASRLLAGNLAIHEELEKNLAAFKGEDSATLFSSGYLANLGAVRLLASPGDVVVLDRLSHASLIDGARLSGATLRVYAHRDVADLERILKRGKPSQRKVVLTDSYFSMDGTVAPLDRIFDVCAAYDAALIVDEAHAFGVYGETGSGLIERFGLKGKVPVVVGTLSKTLGSVGGFVCGSRLVRRALVNFCRSFIYTTGPAPASSGAALAALKRLQKSPALRQKLWSNVSYFRDQLKQIGWDAMESEGPIVPLLVGDPQKATHIQQRLMKRGYVVPAIRPPSVRKGTERMRVSITASHKTEHLDGLLAMLKKIRKEWL